MPRVAVSVEDRLELHELIWRYSMARDDTDLDTLVDCFAPEGAFVRRGRIIRGRPALREYYLSSADRYDLTIHVNHGMVLDGAELGRVTGVVVGRAELVLEGRLVVASYRYRDTYRRLERRWLIEQRAVHFVYSMPVAELAGNLGGGLRLRWPGEAPAVADIPESLPTWHRDTDRSGTTTRSGPT